jgi:2-methylcitrate dehydratase PrpD
MMGLTQRQITDAIDIYVVGNVALNQTRAGSVSNWKACSSPDASRKAVFAVQLSQAGLTGPEQVFEGRGGFCNRIKRFQLPALSSAAQTDALLQQLWSLDQLPRIGGLKSGTVRV